MLYHIRYVYILCHLVYQSCAHIIYAPIGLDNKNSNERWWFITLLSKELLCLVQYQIGSCLGPPIGHISYHLGNMCYWSSLCNEICFAGPIQDTYLSLFHEKANLASYYVISCPNSKTRRITPFLSSFYMRLNVKNTQYRRFSSPLSAKC